jgi:hypothetical protein
MSRPPINVVKVTKALSSTKNDNLEVTFIDGSQIERVLNLSARAQDGLLRGILCTTPSTSTVQGPSKIFVPQNIYTVEMLGEKKDKLICLEVLLSPGVAFRIGLPGKFPQQTIDAIQQMLQPPAPLH